MRDKTPSPTDNCYTLKVVDTPEITTPREISIDSVSINRTEEISSYPYNPDESTRIQISERRRTPAKIKTKLKQESFKEVTQSSAKHFEVKIKKRFVILTDGSLILGSALDSEHLSHTNLAGGDNVSVLAAGEMTFKGGQLIKVNNKTGHYRVPHTSIFDAVIPCLMAHNDGASESMLKNIQFCRIVNKDKKERLSLENYSAPTSKINFFKNAIDKAPPTLSDAQPTTHYTRPRSPTSIADDFFSTETDDELQNEPTRKIPFNDTKGGCRSEKYLEEITSNLSTYNENSSDNNPESAPKRQKKRDTSGFRSYSFFKKKIQKQQSEPCNLNPGKKPILEKMIN